MEALDFEIVFIGDARGTSFLVFLGQLKGSVGEQNRTSNKKN